MRLGEAERLSRINAVDREAHVYLVDAEKVYFKVYRDTSLIHHNFSCVYLGIGMEPGYSCKLNYPLKRKGKNNPDVKVKFKNSYFKQGMKCCYCEVDLNIKTCTKEHVIPKHKGGKLIKPCCSICNGEKGGLMLSSYIMILEDKPNVGYRHKLKIKNAKAILKEIEYYSTDEIKKATNLKD